MTTNISRTWLAWSGLAAILANLCALLPFSGTSRQAPVVAEHDTQERDVTVGATRNGRIFDEMTAKVNADERVYHRLGC